MHGWSCHSRRSGRKAAPCCSPGLIQLLTVCQPSTCFLWLRARTHPQASTNTEGGQRCGSVPSSIPALSCFLARKTRWEPWRGTEMDRGTEGQARIEMRDGRGSTKFQCPKLWAAVPSTQTTWETLGRGVPAHGVSKETAQTDLKDPALSDTSQPLAGPGRQVPRPWNLLWTNSDRVTAQRWMHPSLT